MAFKINVNTTNTGSFGIVAEGKYEATIVRAKLEEYQGNHNIGFDIEIRSDVEQPHGGAKVLYNTLYLTSNKPEYAEKTQQKINAFFSALGCEGDLEIDVEEELKKAVGKNVVAYVSHYKKDDNTYPRVGFVGKSKDIGFKTATKFYANGDPNFNNDDTFTNKNNNALVVDDSSLPF